jgi:aspartyl aminopeptidase
MSKLLEIIKDLLPFLKSAAERAFEKLPTQEQDQVKAVSTAVQVVKLAFEQKKSVTETVDLLLQTEGVDKANVEAQLIAYVKQKGEEAGSLQEAVSVIFADATTRTETGLKALWTEASQTISHLVANIDWGNLLFLAVQEAYEAFVKGKVKI